MKCRKEQPHHPQGLFVPHIRRVCGFSLKHFNLFFFFFGRMFIQNSQGKVTRHQSGFNNSSSSLGVLFLVLLLTRRGKFQALKTKKKTQKTNSAKPNSIDSGKSHRVGDLNSRFPPIPGPSGHVLSWFFPLITPQGGFWGFFGGESPPRG